MLLLRGEREPFPGVQSATGWIGRVHPDLIGGRICKTGERKCFRSIGRISSAVGLSIAALDRPAERISFRVIDWDAPSEAQRVIGGAIRGGR